jgi:hypothetical protein
VVPVGDRFGPQIYRRHNAGEGWLGGRWLTAKREQTARQPVDDQRMSERERDSCYAVVSGAHTEVPQREREREREGGVNFGGKGFFWKTLLVFVFVLFLLVLTPFFNAEF